MRSSFTTMALALAFVTVTALPAMAFTLGPESQSPAGDEAKAAPPELQVDREMKVLVLPGAMPASPGGAKGLSTPESSPVAAFPSRNQPASPVGTKGLSTPENSPVAAFPSRNQPAAKATMPSGDTAGQKVRSQAAIGQKVKPAAIAPNN